MNFCQVSLPKFVTVPVKDMNRSTSAESMGVELLSGTGLPSTAQIETMKLWYHIYSQMEIVSVTMEQ